MIRAHNLRIIAAGGILAIVDLEIVPWRITFRRCRWKRDGGQEVVRLACDDMEFWSRHDAAQFQRAALAAIHQLAERALAEVSAP